VRELARDQRVRNDPNRVTAGFEHGVRDDTHQTNAAASEDQTDCTARHLATKLHCCFSVLRVVPRT